MQMQGLKLMILKYDLETSLQKYDTFHEKTDIKLLFDLLPAICYLLHGRPLPLAPNMSHKLIEKITYEGNEVKILRFE